MTNEEAIEIIKKDIPCEHDTDLIEALDVAIKALEQQPCDDAISREDRLIDLANAIESDDSGYWTNKRISSALRNISSVTQRTNCQYRHENGNCLKVGGFCTSVDDKHCPSVTQKSGKWIVHPEIETSTPDYLMFYECSECGDKQCFCKSDIHKKRFCSNCGAKMQESKETGEIHCNHTDTEIAKSFIEDVEAVKELLPKAGK